MLQQNVARSSHQIKPVTSRCFLCRPLDNPPPPPPPPPAPSQQCQLFPLCVYLAAAAQPRDDAADTSVTQSGRRYRSPPSSTPSSSSCILHDFALLSVSFYATSLWGSCLKSLQRNQAVRLRVRRAHYELPPPSLASLFALLCSPSSLLSIHGSLPFSLNAKENARRSPELRSNCADLVFLSRAQPSCRHSLFFLLFFHTVASENAAIRASQQRQ